MPEPAHQHAQQDEAAVAAVRGGDAERYRELVERHERRVFAVAWSRLGDAALAEEATQEAFIRAYRRLWLLGDGAKFAGWVNTIVRRVAINFGLRHRRELNKRERWALENPAPAAEPSTSEPDPLYPPETLRQTLAELPNAHRECLVLFYLEGKSGAEAAVALGISEAALRVRLHRARAALRERLEEKLAGSLAQLRPAKTLVPAVMAGVLASSSAKAATAGGAGAAILGTLAKFTPFKWMVGFLGFIPLVLPVIMVLPGLMINRWSRRDERRNYRDPEGFRASLHRQQGKGIWVFFIVMIGMMVVVLLISTQLRGAKAVFLITGLFSLVAVGFGVRQLQINRSAAQLGGLLSLLVICPVTLAIGLDRLPILAIGPFLLLSSFVILLTNRSRPARMDYNLFLRASQGLLPLADLPARNESSTGFDRARLRAFARILGERRLAVSFRWGADGLTLFLPGLRSPWGTACHAIFTSARNDSNLTLGWNGSVTALCGTFDAVGLAALPGHSNQDRAQLEMQVAAAVSLAWRNHREGQTALAERALGQIPEAEIFVVPSAHTKTHRMARILGGGLMALSLTLFGLIWIFPEQLAGLKHVDVTEAQVRTFLNDTAPNPDPKKYKFNDPDFALSQCLVFPPTNLFSPEGYRAMRARVFLDSRWSVEQPDPEWEASRLDNLNSVKRAIEVGWIGWVDVHLQPQEITDFIHHHQKSEELQLKLEYLLTPEKAWSWVEQKSWEVRRVSHYTLTQLHWLEDVNCLDLIDRATLIQQIVSVQTLSGTPPGQPPIHDWRDVRGLFFTPCWPALQDTYYSLAALEILGGLDKIDREACIKGILRRHEGKGFFTSPSSGSINEYHIDGSARDAIAAYESLRILGALDRVKDLDRWQFRVASRNYSKPDANGIRTLTWDEVEAWVCQQRLQQILSERQANPQKPFGSLLDPPGV